MERGLITAGRIGYILLILNVIDHDKFVAARAYHLKGRHPSPEKFYAAKGAKIIHMDGHAFLIVILVSRL